MYVGEVEVKQNDLDDLIKAAECLRIKGLGVPDEDLVSSECSKNQQKISSLGVNSDNISKSTDITEVIIRKCCRYLDLFINIYKYNLE